MSVYASQRKKSDMQFMANALKMQDEILGRWEHNFGIKFTKRVYDPETGKVTENTMIPYKRWLAEDMAKRMIATVNDMVDAIYAANDLYPAFEFEVEDRRQLINQAIGDCSKLQGQMRALVRNFSLDVNKMMPITGLIVEEQKLLRGWKKDNNRFYKEIAEKRDRAAARAAKTPSKSAANKEEKSEK